MLHMRHQFATRAMRAGAPQLRTTSHLTSTMMAGGTFGTLSNAPQLGGTSRTEQLRFSSTGKKKGASGSSKRSGGAGEADDESSKIAAALEADPRLMEEVVAMMSPEQRRRLTVAGGAYEWFGKDRMQAEVKTADADNDKVISPRDFNHWFENALKRHTETASPKGTESVNPVPMAALFLIALETGLPFVGFGFLDNATMILAGDAIDKTLGLYFNCSMMACAALGNVVSGTMGMQVHGGVEKLVQRVGLPVPILTTEQQRSQRVFLAGHLGGTIGIAIGLTLGMLPLFFLKTDEDDHSERKIFNQVDENGDGLLSRDEVAHALKSAGIKVSEESLNSTIAKYGTQDTPNGEHALCFTDFQSLCEDLKSH